MFTKSIKNKNKLDSAIDSQAQEKLITRQIVLNYWHDNGRFWGIRSTKKIEGPIMRT